MLIAQISDTHIAEWGKKTYGIAPMAENLARCVEDINQLTPRPDVTIVTGDITKDGLEAETERAADILNKLQMPFFVIPGNHDDKLMLHRVFGSTACPAESGNFINYVIDDYAVRLIALDSTVAGAPGGEISSQQAVWLEQCLVAEKGKPTAIFMHHPPVEFGVLETDMDGFVGAERFGTIIEKFSNIEQIICGHIHLPANVKWRGTIVSTAPSPGIELLLDLTMKLESAFIPVEPCYQLHYWTPQRRLITHTAYIRNRIKSYPFKEHIAEG